jgi:hypothetical protein
MLISFTVALGFLAGGLFWVGPHLQASVSEGAANIFYIALRVLVIAIFSFVAVRRYGKNTYHALSFAGLLIFLDQVGLRSIWFAIQFHNHPADWKDVTLGAVLFNSAFSYIVFLPLVIMIAFAGAAAAQLIGRKAQPKSLL